MIFINVFAFLYARANHKEIFEEMSVPFFFSEKCIFAEIKGQLSRRNAWLPQFFFVDSNSPCKDLLFPHVPTLAQKLLYSE